MGRMHLHRTAALPAHRAAIPSLLAALTAAAVLAAPPPPPLLSSSPSSSPPSFLSAALAASAADCDASAIRADARSGLLLDACGRQRIFRGINSVRKGAPFLARSDQFEPAGQSLSAADAVLWQSLGLNLVRLGIMWEGVVPSRGAPDAALLAAYAETAAGLFAAGGVRALLDAHQDGFSAQFCDDGGPPWAARDCAARAPGGGAAGFPLPLAAPFPLDNATGLPEICSSPNISGWAELYVTYAVGACFGELYGSSGRAGEPGSTQQAFIDFWVAVVAAFAQGPGGGAAVLAYELLNEPWAGDALADPALLVPGVADAASLQPFYANVTAAIRAAEAALNATSRIIAMEPVTWDVVFPAGFSSPSGAWPASGLELLSYHYYELPDIQGSALQVESRAADARRLGAAALLTEYDLGLVSPVNAPYTKLDMRATLDACDAARHGNIGWDYSCVFQGGDGSTLHAETVRELARPVPLALAGAGNASWRFAAADERAPRFELEYAHERAVAERGGVSTVFLSTGLWFDAATLNVSVASSPPGAVTWSLARTRGQVSLPAANASQLPAPAPFDFTILTIASAPGAPDVAAVSVVVTS